MSIGMTVGLTQVQSYTIIAEANGFAMGKSPTAPSPYAVWQIDDDGKGVCIGHYFVDREEAEWDFCARAFEWFEDNMHINMIEEDEEHPCDGCRYNTNDYVCHPHCSGCDGKSRFEKEPFGRGLINGLRAIRANMTAASQLVDEMCAEIDKLKAEREVSE